MAWREVTGGSAVDIKKQGKGYQIEGIYKGYKKITTKLGEQWIYCIETEEGDVEFFGFAALNFKLGHIKEGANIRITYEGQFSVKNKFGKFPHMVKVEEDQGDGEEGGSETPF